MTKEEIIEKIKSTAKELNKDNLSKTEFKRVTGINEWQVIKYFTNWTEAVFEAGLNPNDVSRIEDSDLFSEMIRVFSENGICTRTTFDKLAKYSVDVYKKHFGKWKNVLGKLKEHIVKNHIDVGFLVELETMLMEPEILEKPILTSIDRMHSWQATGNSIYGPYLNFRGLQHAPINEQGVVFLFGMIAFELGFVVEAIQTGFPDCEAKRRIDSKSDRWEKVRIEFEYKSRHFLDHGHDIKGCDLIVCWENNWVESNIEIIELKSAITLLGE